MRVYTVLLVFAPQNSNACLLTDASGNAPSWLLNNNSGETLDLVRTGLYNISGVSPNFYGQFNQAAFYEDVQDKTKCIYLIYTIYFPEIFELVNQLYKWTAITELDSEANLYNIIRYIYGIKK